MAHLIHGCGPMPPGRISDPGRGRLECGWCMSVGRPLVAEDFRDHAAGEDLDVFLLPLPNVRDRSKR
jgi:hypothetical protein